jgi:hypothetical protein
VLGRKKRNSLYRPNNGLVLETTGVICNKRKETAGKDFEATLDATIDASALDPSITWNALNMDHEKNPRCA